MYYLSQHPLTPLFPRGVLANLLLGKQKFGSGSRGVFKDLRNPRRVFEEGSMKGDLEGFYTRREKIGVINAVATR